MGRWLVKAHLEIVHCKDGDTAFVIDILYSTYQLVIAEKKPQNNNKNQGILLNQKSFFDGLSMVFSRVYMN